jgi:hypothetical protein
MHFTILNLLGASAPFVLVATLWSIWKEGRSRSLMLRMLPPERRPVSNSRQPLRFAEGRGTSAVHKRHSVPLWTLQDCQMELLTEGTMHAFEANAEVYVPDRIASSYPPGRVSRRVALSRAGADRADGTSILLRTLERSADMLSAGAAAIYQGEPEIDEGSTDTLLSYIDLARRVRIPKAA